MSVESGEGIERLRSRNCRFFTARVESGEGIESDDCAARFLLEIRHYVESGEGIESNRNRDMAREDEVDLWNPVKELKDYLTQNISPRPSSQWNPVKELKDIIAVKDNSEVGHVESGEGIERHKIKNKT